MKLDQTNGPILELYQYGIWVIVYAKSASRRPFLTQDQQVLCFEHQYRLFLNEGMRAGIPSNDTRARTITLYLDKKDFRQVLDIKHEQSMWIYFLISPAR